jgi:hypothetical protein
VLRRRIAPDFDKPLIGPIAAVAAAVASFAERGGGKRLDQVVGHLAWIACKTSLLRLGGDR